MRKTAVTAMHCEGNSIRSSNRMAGINRNTTMNLGVRVVEGCKRIMDQRVRNLPCSNVQVDEV